MNVYTDPEYRRKGISTRLMKNLIEFSKSLELDFIELCATEDGYSMYKKLGFEEHLSGYTEMRYNF